LPRKKLKPGIEAACYQAWSAKRSSILNGSATIRDVWNNEVPKFLAKWKDRKDWPSESWFTKRISDVWEPSARTKPLKPDPVIESWDEKWWKSPRKIYVLTTLYDQASLAVEWHQQTRWNDSTAREFNGFTDRICKWAWKLSEFFDLNVSRECYLLIHIANLFAYEERKREERPEYDRSLEEGPPIALGREQLAAWQRHKMGDKTPEGGIGRYLWQVETEQLRIAIVYIVTFGQVLVMVGDGSKTDQPSISVVIE